MRHRVLLDGDLRTLIAVFDTGDDVLPGLQELAEAEDLDGCSFTAVGAFEEAVLGWYDLEAQEYRDIPVRKQCEVLTMTGDITRSPKGRTVHAHVVVGLRDGTTRGGHVLSAKVRPTLEVVLNETPAQLHRTFDPNVGIALIDLTR
jgi:predicted DNA-binding protein with PD1-like motif